MRQLLPKWADIRRYTSVPLQDDRLKIELPFHKFTLHNQFVFEIFFPFVGTERKLQFYGDETHCIAPVAHQQISFRSHTLPTPKYFIAITTAATSSHVTMSTTKRHTFFRCGLLTLMALAGMAQGQVDLPKNLLPDLIVEDCAQELREATRCVVGTLCFDITEVLTEDSFPVFSDVFDCVDLEEPLCPIISACPGCEADLEALFLCQFVGSSETVGNATEIVADCAPLLC
jgi:hypothetical protein